MMTKRFMTAPKTPVEAGLLRILGTFVYLRADQVTKHSYSPNSLRSVQKRLNTLCDDGLAEKHKAYNRVGKPPYVYSPSTLGWSWLETQGMRKPKRWKPAEEANRSYIAFQHDLAVADFGILGFLLGKYTSPNVVYLDFVHDRFLPPFPVILPDGKKQSIRLDGLLSLAMRRNSQRRGVKRVLSLELDRSSHYRTALEQKIRGLLSFIDSCLILPDIGVSSNELTYLFICPDDQKRVVQLLDYTRAVLIAEQKLLYSEYFFFTSSNPATTDPIKFFVSEPIWFQPHESDRPRPLLGLPAPQTTALIPPTIAMPEEAMAKFYRQTGTPIPSLNLESELDD